MNTTERKGVRQGDIVLAPITEAQIPKNMSVVAPENGRVIVARGEKTGHHHSILAENVALFRDDGAGGGLFLAVSGNAPVKLEHQEHRALDIAPGDYRVIGQRQASDDQHPQRVSD